MARYALIWILLGAFALRIAAAFGLQHYLDARQRTFLISGDAEGYWDLGSQIAQGKPYELYQPPRRVMRMPGYPAFVAVAIRLSELLHAPQRDHLIARLLLAGVGTAACGLVAVLGRELFDAQTGLIAAAITAVAPPLLGFSVILLSETLFAAAMLVSLWCAARMVRGESAESGVARTCGWAALTGLTIGLAVYVRPSWLLVSPLLAVLFMLHSVNKRHVLLPAFILLICTYGSLVPWACRNFELTGHWIFTTLWVGPSLYDGFHPHATGDSNLQFFEIDQPLLRMSEYDADRFYRGKAWAFIRDDPGRAFVLTGIKLMRYWKPWPSAKELGGLALRIAVAAYFVPVVIAAVLGWALGPRNFWGWVLVLGPIFYFAAVHAVFLGSLRYRLPAEYPLCIAAAVGFRQIADRLRPGISHTG